MPVLFYNGIMFANDNQKKYGMQEMFDIDKKRLYHGVIP